VLIKRAVTAMTVFARRSEHGLSNGVWYALEALPCMVESNDASALCVRFGLSQEDLDALLSEWSRASRRSHLVASQPKRGSCPTCRPSSHTCTRRAARPASAALRIRTTARGAVALRRRGDRCVEEALPRGSATRSRGRPVSDRRRDGADAAQLPWPRSSPQVGWPSERH